MNSVRMVPSRQKITHSFKSMISKPLAHKTTILAFRKMRSKDSVGKKKSL